MSQARIEQLEDLLLRVQKNRMPKGTTALAASPAAANTAGSAGARALAAAPAPVSPAPVVRSAPPAPPPKPTPFRNPLAEPPAKPAESFAKPEPIVPGSVPARRPGQDRRATPLEMAVAELGFTPPSSTATTPGTVAAEARREPPVSHVSNESNESNDDPEIDLTQPEDSLAPLVIEPEAIREPARPIAQVVSRHAPQVDATFGAMLKRSLSLRPH